MTSDDRPRLVRADRQLHDRPGPEEAARVRLMRAQADAIHAAITIAWTLILGGLIIGSVWAIVDAVSR